MANKFALVLYGNAIKEIQPGDTLNVSITGNAASADTVTTNADLTGHIVSTGNTTSLGSFTIAQLNTAVSDANVAILGANTFTADQTFGDNKLIQFMMKDQSYAFVDKGNSGTATQTFDYSAGSHQKVTATGNHAIAFSNWAPTGSLSELLIEYENGGAYSLDWGTSVTWIKPDGTKTTSFASYLTALNRTLQTSGTDFIFLWTRDNGTTIYGEI